MISTLVVRSSEANVFEAIRYFFLRDAIKAIQAFETLLNSGESPILIVSLIARQARLLLKLYCGYQSNLQGPKLAQYLKIPPYFLKQYEAEASKWDVSSLNHLLSDLSELDLRLKTKSQDVSEVILNWTLAHTF
jgi:DNA polymerase-3 subunit delta